MLIKNPVIGILLGDPAGVGPEIVAKACQEGIVLKESRPLLLGDKRVLEQARTLVGADFPYTTISSPEEYAGNDGEIVLLDQGNISPDEYSMGQLNPSCGRAVIEQIELAGKLFQGGIIHAICFGPFNKAAIKAAGRHDVESELTLFVDTFGNNGPIGEMNVVGNLWTSRVTSHIPLGDIRQHLTVEKVLDAIRLLYRTLLKAGNSAPRIAICALNPHGGESGTCGREELDIIQPAAEIAVSEGIDVQGVFPADTVFMRAFGGGCDGVVTIYHDQGQIALKLKGFHEAVTVEAGLALPVSTPAHGTAFNIAGKGEADPNPFRMAYGIAVKHAQNGGSL